MFQNILNPTPKSPSQLTSVIKPKYNNETLTVDDATMNVIIWLYVFPFLKLILEAFKFIYIFKII